jgi:uridine kinase
MKQNIDTQTVAEIANKQETCSLEEGVIKLQELINKKLQEKEGTVIVEIAGGSASGKTSAVSKKIKDFFGDEAMIFSMDDYYRGRTYMAEEAKRGNILNYDQPEVINLPLLKSHLADLKNGISIQKPVYSFVEGEAVGTETLNPKRIVIIEGLFALNDELVSEGDVKAFVDIGTHGRILRRLLRDVERTGEKPEDILSYFSDVVEPMHIKYIDTTKKNAEIIISNEFNPSLEADRAKKVEKQIKYEGEIDSEYLRKVGAERINSVVQVDTYYKPNDRDLIDTNELLRIREENGHRILTYKGPQKESELRMRYKFEFEISEDVENSFAKIYGKNIKVIKKERTLYHLDNVVFSLDKVRKIEEGEETSLGSFIEIRFPENLDLNSISETLEKLGLKDKQNIKKSYFEM